jgi:FkbM family methyltransferase
MWSGYVDAVGQVQLSPSGFTLVFPDGDYIGQRVIDLQMPYEYFAIRAVEAICGEAEIIDVGANIGNHAVYWARAGSRVHAYEPNPEALYWLRKNVELNDLEDRIEIHAVAVGEESGFCSVTSTTPGNLGATRFDTHPAGDYPIVSLDNEALSNIGALKIDVEGHEVEVLNGARRLLEAEHPVLMVEAWSKHQLRTIDDKLRPLAYRRLPFRVGGGPTYLYAFRARGVARLLTHGPVWNAGLRVMLSAARSRARSWRVARA